MPPAVVPIQLIPLKALLGSLREVIGKARTAHRRIFLIGQISINDARGSDSLPVDARVTKRLLEQP